MLAGDLELAALLLDVLELAGVLDRQHRLGREICSRSTTWDGKSPGAFRQTERPPKMRSARRSGTFSIALNPDFAIRLRSCGS